MMKPIEIGSEFWTAEIGKPSQNSRKTYLSGRTALAAVILACKRKGVRTVCLPDYCCESMIEPFLRQEMKISFYPVWYNETGLAFSLEKVNDADAVLLVNYFGFMTENMTSTVLQCRKAGIVAILDLTHAVLSEDSDNDADYIFGSYRKWTGVEAGVASGFYKNELDSWLFNEAGSQYLALRKQARSVKTEFVADGYRNENLRNKQLALFKKSEEYLDREYYSDTDEKNKTLMKSLDVDFIRDKRRKNAGVIYEYFPILTKCKPLFSQLPTETIPLMVPVLVTEGRRDSLRKFLRENRVFCPTHWPLSELHKAGNGALELFRNELSLVCDQRYEVSDITRMMEMVKQWEKTSSV